MPAGNRLRCQTCKKQFTRPIQSSRLNCFDCRPSRAQNVVSGNFGQNPAENGENPENDGPLTRKSLKQLQEWGVEDSWQAEAVLTLARQIDSGKGSGSAGVAGAIKAHRDAMSVAQAVSVVGDADVIDILFAADDA